MRDAFSRVLPASLLALAIPVGAGSRLFPDADGGDLWWHLAAGRWIAEAGAVPDSDVFSHTAAGADWQNHEWLWDLLAWLAYRAHPDALAWGQAGVLLATFSLVGLVAWRKSGSGAAALLSTWCAAAVCHWFLDVRPHAMTLLGVAALLASRDARRAPWLWPPLFALWANLHAGFVFGLGVIGLDVACRWLAALRRAGPRALPFAHTAGLGIAVLAAGLNPFGFSLFLLPLETLDAGSPFRDLIEWYPLEPDLDPRGHAGRAVWLALLALPGVWRARRDPFWLALFATTLAMTLAARRFVPLFAICAAPLLALGLAAIGATLRAQMDLRITPMRRLALGIAALGVALGSWWDVRLLPRPLDRWTSSHAFPGAAVDYLATLDPVPSRLLNAYSFGGYVMLRAPGIPVFIDGRAGTVYADDVARDYLVAVEAAEGWQEVIERRAIDAVLLEPRSPLVAALMGEDPPWPLALRGPQSVVLLHPRRGDPPDAMDRLGFSAEVAVLEGFEALRRRRLPAARRAFEAALERDPLQMQAYRGLMELAAVQRDLDAVDAIARRALDAAPRREELVWAFAARAYRILGAARAELDAQRRRRPRGPFARPAELAAIDARIRVLEERQGAAR